VRSDADPTGTGRLAAVQVVKAPPPGGGRAVVQLRITLGADHPLDSGLHATIAREIGVAGRLLHGRGSAVQPNVLVAGPPLWSDGGPRGLSPDDVGAMDDLVTRVLEYTTTADPVQRTRAASEIEAVRRALGLDPEFDGEHAAGRWELVDGVLGDRVLPPAARRHLDALRRPGWRRDLVLLDVVDLLADGRGGPAVRGVTIAADGALVVSTRRRPGGDLRSRVRGATLPAGALFAAGRAPDGSLVVRVR